MTLDDSVEAFCRTHEISRDDVEALLEPLRREAAEANQLAASFQLMIDGYTGNLETSQWSRLFDQYTEMVDSWPKDEMTQAIREKLRETLVAYYDAARQTADYHSDAARKEHGTLLVLLADRSKLYARAMLSGAAAGNVE